MAVFTGLAAIPFVSSLILIVSCLALYLAYYLKTAYTYWEKRGVPYAKPVLFFGSMKDAVLRRTPMAFVLQQINRELDGHKYGGFYQMTKPAVMIRDPELIMTVLVKKFAHLHDRNLPPVDEKIEPLGNNIAHLCGQRWKNVRAKLTPTFSSGKLRLMEPLIKDCVDELNDYLKQVTSEGSKTGDIQNVNELMAKFTIDVIGTCVFGLQCNTIRDPDSEFRRIYGLFVESTRSSLWNLLRIINPRLIGLFKVKSLNTEIEDFFKSVFEQAVKHRESSAQRRNDFLQLMIDIQAEEKANLKNAGLQQNGQNGYHVEENRHEEKLSKETPDILFTESIIASNALVFFTGGFENIAGTLSFCLYELALNPEICEGMKDEVEVVKRAHSGNLDYDAMKELTYIEAVISETLRKYPIAPGLARRCTESFQMPDSSTVIEKGVSVYISVYALHHDPKYFPEPEKFLPERFSKKNKDFIVPGTYLPFGDGPRMCIAMRFAKFQMKSALVYLVSNYTFHPCEKTVIPLKFDPHTRFSVLSPVGGIWVRFQRRPRLDG